MSPEFYQDLQPAIFNNCATCNTCFYRKSNSLLSICEKSQGCFKNPSNFERLQTKFQEFCQSKPIVAAKAINLKHLKYLELLHLQGEKTFFKNFYIIYLVRDPRGLYNSRRKLYQDPKILNHYLETGCQNYENTLNYLNSPSGKYLRDKFLFIRYEDLALNPGWSLDQIYQFIDCKTNFTKSDDDECNLHELKKQFLEITDQTSSLKIGYDDYGTTNRNSKSTAFKWMTELPFKTVQAVQNNCAPGILDTFGYKIYGNSSKFYADRNSRKYNYDTKSTLENWKFKNMNGRFVS